MAHVFCCVRLQLSRWVFKKRVDVIPALIYGLSERFDVIAVHIVVILHELVDMSLWTKLDDAVCHCLDELVVVGREEHIALEEFQVVVEGLDGFEVEVVGGGVENEAVGIAQLHASYHASHLLAS